MVGPARLLPSFHAPQLVLTPRRRVLRVIEDRSTPGGAIERVEILRYIAANFAQSRDIAAQHRSAARQCFQKRKAEAFGIGGQQ